MTLEEHLEEYKENGFTIFKNVFNLSQMQAWKDSYKDISKRQTAPGTEVETAWWLQSCVEYQPDLFLPAVSHPLLLDFAELVMGPFVQLDNLTFAAFPSVEKEEALGKVSGWHRDIWAYRPTHSEYIAPLAANAITYLQDMSEEYGPLRVIPGSHRKTLSIGESERNKPHKDEVIVNVEAGDIVFTHAALYHSGTPNYSGNPRYFFSIYYNKSWMKCRDNHNGPAVQSILEAARKKNDRRLIRLFAGEDPAIMLSRVNSGFWEDDEVTWKKWIQEDREALCN